MARAGCKFIVHFSMLFSTTRTSFRKNGTLLFCRLSHSRLRHLLDDFRKFRFWPIAFLFFSYPYTQDFTSPDRLLVNFDQAKLLGNHVVVTVRKPFLLLFHPERFTP